MATTKVSAVKKLEEAIVGLRKALPAATLAERKEIRASLQELTEAKKTLSAMEEDEDYPKLMMCEPAAEPEGEPDEEEVISEESLETFEVDDSDDDELLAVSGLALAAKALRSLSAADDADDLEDLLGDLPSGDEEGSDDSDLDMGDLEDLGDEGDAEGEGEDDCVCPPEGDLLEDELLDEGGEPLLTEEDLKELEEAGLLEGSARKSVSAKNRTQAPARVVKPAAKKAPVKATKVDPKADARQRLHAAIGRLDKMLDNDLGKKKTPVRQSQAR